MKISRLAPIFALSFLLPGILLADSPAPAIRIGVILPLTGEFARYGQQMRQGIERSELAKNQLIFEDEGCDAGKSITAYRKLTDLFAVRIFVGPGCGSPQSAVAPLLKLRRQLAILGNSAPRGVFKASGGRMFSTQYSNEDEAAFMGNNIYRLGARRAALIFFENQFSRAHEKAFRESFPGQVLETFAYATSDVSNLKTIPLRLRRLGVDALYVPDAFPLMQGLMKELHNQGLGTVAVFSVYSAQSDDVLQALGPYGEGLVYAYPDIGGNNALDYFPGLAAKIASAAVAACGDDADCALEYIKKNYPFNQDGVLEGRISLKTVKNGAFSAFTPEVEKEWRERHGGAFK